MRDSPIGRTTALCDSQRTDGDDDGDDDSHDNACYAVPCTTAANRRFQHDCAGSEARYRCGVCFLAFSWAEYRCVVRSHAHLSDHFHALVLSDVLVAGRRLEPYQVINDSFASSVRLYDQEVLMTGAKGDVVGIDGSSRSYTHDGNMV